MPTPPVSIGLPVYNGEAYLDEAIRSVRAQTFPDFELIVSDNASTDRTREICEHHASTDRRIRYLRHDTNRGAAWNFNHVAQQAQGELFKWMGHDDVCLPGLLERSVQVLRDAPPSVVLCHSGTLMIDAEGRVTERYQDRIDLRQDAPHERLGRLYWELSRCNAIFGLIRRDALMRTRLLGGYGSADTVLLAELALRGQLWYFPEFLFKRRIHAEQAIEAHPDARSLARWFDPASSDQRFILPRWRLLKEQRRAIAGAPITSAERIRCYIALAQFWLRRHRSMLVDDVGRAIAQYRFPQ